MGAVSQEAIGRSCPGLDMHAPHPQSEFIDRLKTASSKHSRKSPLPCRPSLAHPPVDSCLSPYAGIHHLQSITEAAKCSHARQDIETDDLPSPPSSVFRRRSVHLVEIYRVIGMSTRYFKVITRPPARFDHPVRRRASDKPFRARSTEGHRYKLAHAISAMQRRFPPGRTRGSHTTT